MTIRCSTVVKLFLVLAAPACNSAENPFDAPGFADLDAGGTTALDGRDAEQTDGGSDAQVAPADDDGGSSGGVSAGAGGRTSTGGALPATGGKTTSTGGIPSSGGHTSTGGRTSTGGAAPSTGGAPTTGGVTNTGGVTGCTEVTHDNGFGQSWKDCTPKSTYTWEQAKQACAAWCAQTACQGGCFDASACGVSAVLAENNETMAGWDLDGNAVKIDPITQTSCIQSGVWN